MIESVIQTSVVPQLALYGFRYEGKPDVASWQFARQADNLTQYVTFLESLHRNKSLRVEFSTSEDTLGVEASMLLKGRETQSWWTFTDEGSLVSVVQELIELTLSEGLRWFGLPVGKPFQPTGSHGRELLSNPSVLADALADNLYIELGNPTNLKILQEFVEQQTTSGVMEASDIILQASAYLGESLRMALDGQWVWDEEFKTPAVLLRVGDPPICVRPLVWISNLWAKPGDPRYHLLDGYHLYQKLSRS
jgi:hypothetical protein